MLRKICLFTLVTSLYSSLLLADTKKEINPDTQLQSWTINEAGLELKFSQLLPNQTRAFYLARGFTGDIANNIAINCMIQTVAKNTASKKTGQSITIRLKDWLIKPHHADADDKQQGIKLKEIWNDSWKENEVNNAARIAFRWATFPTEQTFDPSGDYNWGMTSFGLPPSSKFDLKVIWYQDGQQKSVWIQDMTCAEDK